ncbi:MAG TPA: xanthine dehydrogenase family protein subunit M [Solirubrobacteraceae bacterium]|nr:xanthine dehydrogenase family protein subunit M [Solirubrobacteraceae bacterium]
MKPAPFDYLAPQSVAETLQLLARHGAEGKVLAGGQSLMPMLNFRLAQPEAVIDINNVAELSYITREQGELRIGALTRHAELERSPIVAAHWPLLTEALRWLAHPPIRNRGTVGGSVAHADPAAELPVALTALDARFIAESHRGGRVLDPGEMFAGPLQSGLEPDELLVEIRVPAVPSPSGCAFVEHARRHGDFALGGVAVVLVRDGDRCREGGARIVLLGAGPGPRRVPEAEALLAAGPVDEESARAAGEAAGRAAEPPSDPHADAGHRRRLAVALTRRAVLQAWERA